MFKTILKAFGPRRGQPFHPCFAIAFGYFGFHAFGVVHGRQPKYKHHQQGHQHHETNVIGIGPRLNRLRF
jgi:hypothetical protein